MRKNLKDFPIIKTTEDEEILLVQRQHPIVLFSQMFFISGMLLLIPALFMFVSSSLPCSPPLPCATLNIIYNQALLSFVLLTALCAFLTAEIYIFMKWYYHFYIITNKTVIERFSFRIGGPYSEVVVGENMHIQEIIREAPNIIYDFLKIQNVSVYFHKLEREEPFIFRLPQDAQAIDDLLDSLIAESDRKRNARTE